MKKPVTHTGAVRKTQQTRLGQILSKTQMWPSSWRHDDRHTANEQYQCAKRCHEFYPWNVCHWLPVVHVRTATQCGWTTMPCMFCGPIRNIWAGCPEEHDAHSSEQCANGPARRVPAAGIRYCTPKVSIWNKYTCIYIYIYIYICKPVYTCYRSLSLYIYI